MDAARHCAHFARDYLDGGAVPSASSAPSSLASLASRRSGGQTPRDERAAFCEAFERDAVVLGLYREIFAECGVDPGTTCWDRVRLRVQQSGAGLDTVDDSLHGSGKYSSTLPIHRDTWASNIMQQINVWMPLAEIDAGRTLAIHPSFFDMPVPNSSETWDFAALKRARKTGTPYPQLPMVTLEAEGADGGASGGGGNRLDTSLRQRIEDDACPVVIAPGDVLLFSGAHLHSSVLNFTGKTRFSTEIRMVDAEDFSRGEGAPNVDGRAPCRPTEWFRSMDTRTPLHRVAAGLREHVP